MQTTLRKYEGTSAANIAAGHAIVREHCIAASFPVNPGMLDKN
jgi:hypothetical protein